MSVCMCVRRAKRAGVSRKRKREKRKEKAGRKFAGERGKAGKVKLQEIGKGTPVQRSRDAVSIYIYII